MKYVIKRRSRVSGGLVEFTLCKNGEWWVATNEPMRFFNPRKASHWACQNLEVDKLQPYVAGPNGGQYRVSTGKIKLTGKNI
jgi:hypothetical protein